jgi:Flp pilus assembly protein TadD
MTLKIVRQLMESATRAHSAGQLDQACALYQQVLAVRPGYPDAVHLLGVIACQRGQYDRGLTFISTAISASPNQSEFHNSLGNALRGLKRLDDAIIAHRRAVELDPNNLPALNNLAMALDYQDRSTDALQCLDRLIAAKDDVPQWHVNRGAVQFNTGDLASAIASQRRAIALQPDLPGAHAKLATALLASGQFAEGWREYEWRFRAGVIGDPTQGIASPRWDGSPLDGRTLLVHAEQGFGDFFQCARFLPLIAARGGSVILRCQQAVKKLAGQIAGITKLITLDEPVPPHDLQVPIFSLPLLFGADEGNIPRDIPYLFPSPEKAARFARTTPGKRVGLVWAGLPGHGNDRRRSCPAEQFNALARVDNLEFYRLQMPRDLPAPSGLTLIDHTADFTDFDDTAALISQLDLVISVDTSVAHLTGALGKPVWILLPFAAEWRWMTGRSDSPWYPTARLFRQTSVGDWPEVLGQIRDALWVMGLGVLQTSLPTRQLDRHETDR